MFCTKCGNKIEDGVKFCVKCGTPVGATVAATPVQHTPPPVGALVGVMPEPMKANTTQGIAEQAKAKIQQQSQNVYIIVSFILSAFGIVGYLFLDINFYIFNRDYFGINTGLLWLFIDISIHCSIIISFVLLYKYKSKIAMISGIIPSSFLLLVMIYRNIFDMLYRY